MCAYTCACVCVWTCICLCSVLSPQQWVSRLTKEDDVNNQPPFPTIFSVLFRSVQEILIWHIFCARQYATSWELTPHEQSWKSRLCFENGALWHGTDRRAASASSEGHASPQ